MGTSSSSSRRVEASTDGVRVALGGVVPEVVGCVARGAVVATVKRSLRPD
jgi:hypothetical protein